MRILFLSHFFPPSHTAGAENYAYNLARALVHEGHDVYVLCAGTWDSGECYWNGYSDETLTGIHVRRLNLCWHKAPDPNRFLYDNPITAAHLRDWLRQIQPDIVHVISCYTLSASVMQVCKQANVPLVITLVDYWFLCPSLHLRRSDGTLCDGQTTAWDCLKCMLSGAKVYRWSSKLMRENGLKRALTLISRSGLNRLRGLRGMALDMEERKAILLDHLLGADIVLAPSRFLGSIHADVVKGLAFRVQPHGHHLEWVTGFQSRPPDGIVRFCYIGQISHDKGVHLLVEAFLRLGDTCPAELNIWGGINEQNSYGCYLQMLAAQSNRIHFRGRFKRDQLANVLSQADIVVVPSIWYENNPLVIQEAFAVQLPVIATNLGGMAEFVQHEVNGLLFEYNDIQDLAQQMRRIVEESGLLAQLRAGIPLVKKIDQEVGELLSIYEDIWGRKPHG